jgi:hypothetical protein
MIVIIGEGIGDHVQQIKNEPAMAGSLNSCRSDLPVAVMPMPMPMSMPAYFRHRRLRAFLDRSDGGGICQRQRLSLLSRSGKDQYRTNCSEAQNSRHLH